MFSPTNIETPFDKTSIDAVFNTVSPQMTKLMQEAEAAWVALAGISLIVYTVMAYRGRSIPWTAFGYPIASLVLLEFYDKGLAQGLVKVPQSIGIDIAKPALEEAWLQVSATWELWRNPLPTPGGNGLTAIWAMVTGDLNPWNFIVSSLLILPLMGSMLIFWILYLGQVCVIGILYALGPLFMLAVCFRPTASWAMRWATSMVEVASWTLIWGIMLSAVNTLARGVSKAVPDLEDPATLASAFNTLAVMCLYCFLSLATPFIARTLIGGGVGLIGGAAALQGARSVAGTAGATAGGAVSGGVAGAAGGPAGAAAGAAVGAGIGLASSAGVRGLDAGSAGAKAGGAVGGGKGGKKKAA